jgi:hypothetical protein
MRTVRGGPHGRDTLASSTSSRSNIVVHLHTPSRDLKNASRFERLYQTQIRLFPRMSFDIPTSPSINSIDDQQPSGPESGHPESNRTESSRPGSQRSATFVKKEKMKKVGIEDILAMRRMEQGEQDDDEEHPETQTTKVVVTPSQREEVWPTFQFGHEMNDLNV